MPGSETLDETQFAIQRGAKFAFNVAGTVVKVTQNGEMSVTLNFKIADTADLQNIAGEIKIGACGIFVKDKDNCFDVDTDASNLSLDIDSRDRIRLISDQNDLLLMTTAKKGRQGNMFMFAEK